MTHLPGQASTPRSRSSTLSPVPLTASDLLEAGRPILDAALLGHGFTFAPLQAGTGSGGEFATAEYRRQDRRLVISCRWALGLVTYWLGDERIAHEDYMRLAVPRGSEARYPGFGDDPLHGFRRLAYDLEHFGRDFLTGTDADFARWIRAQRERPRATGLGALDSRSAPS